MHTSVILTLAAGLSTGGIAAAAADSDVAVWRWHVTNALRAQQRQDDPPRLQEGRASAIEAASRFRQRYERYFADGSPAPAGDFAHR
ncbi:MAG: hypothetical protein ABSE69_15490 [Roseiarcus sp.]|jgi:hypothetical protein